MENFSPDTTKVSHLYLYIFCSFLFFYMFFSHFTAGLVMDSRFNLKGEKRVVFCDGSTFHMDPRTEPDIRLWKEGDVSPSTLFICVLCLYVFFVFCNTCTSSAA